MSIRLSPWLALLPIALGVAGWWAWWDRTATRWQEALGQAVVPPQRILGFPYRLQADFGPLAVAHAHGGAGVEARAASATVERAFGRAWPHVFAATGTVLRADAAQPAGMTAALEAARLRGSLDLAGGRLNRLSLLLPETQLQASFLGRALILSNAELHLRQTPGNPPPDRGPAPVAELVLTAPSARLGPAGAPLVLELRATLVQRGRLRSVADWAWEGGQLRIDRLILADATGPVFDLAGTATPRPGVGGMGMAATITTPCPASVVAALEGRAPGQPEARRRVPVTIALTGALSRPDVRPSAEALASRPVRAQEPPCPRLAG